MSAGPAPVDAAAPANATTPPDAPVPATGGVPGVDAVLAGLRRQARQLVAELAGPVRRVRLRSGDTVLEVEWHGASASTDTPPAAAAPPAPPAAEPPTRHAVRSPMVGTFYRAPQPGAAPFVAVGDEVRPGQVIGIVEAMKLMNEVTADRAGRVAEVLATDGQPVEYDQPLLALDPA